MTLAPVVRIATIADVAAMHRIRMAVLENQLSDATAVNTESYLPVVTSRSAWVATDGTDIVGFAAIAVTKANVWALFVDPACEGLGAGRALHDHMLRWASDRGLARLWLTTSPGTRGERFYRRSGWEETGVTGAGEIRFERQL